MGQNYYSYNSTSKATISENQQKQHVVFTSLFDPASNSAVWKPEEPMPNSALNPTSLESCIIYAYVITQFSITSNHCNYVNRNKEYHLHLL